MEALGQDGTFPCCFVGYDTAGGWQKSNGSTRCQNNSGGRGFVSMSL
jgi:hypothetical protein